VNAKWFHARRLARRVAGEPLPIWGCMELIAAGPSVKGPESPLASDVPASDMLEVSRSNADLPPFLKVLVEGLESADAFELDRRLQDDVDRALVMRETDVNEWFRCGGLPASAGVSTAAAAMEADRQMGARQSAPEETCRVFFIAPRDVARLFRAVGGNNELGNRTTLCAWHHLRGVHAGIVRCMGDAPDQLRFDLGVRSGGPPLVRYRSGDLVVPTAAGLPG
jgi:hypothetical protein